MVLDFLVLNMIVPGLLAALVNQYFASKLTLRHYLLTDTYYTNNLEEEKD